MAPDGAPEDRAPVWVGAELGLGGLGVAAGDGTPLGIGSGVAVRKVFGPAEVRLARLDFTTCGFAHLFDTPRFLACPETQRVLAACERLPALVVR